MTIGALRIEEPFVLTALLLPLLIGLAVFHARRQRLAARVLLGGPPSMRPGGAMQRTAAGILIAIAVSAAVIAAARPQWGAGERLLEQRGIDLVIALDVSRSMQAKDVEPSRAEAAAQGLGAMLTHLTGNRVGLVTFAGSAFERSPLTSDLDVLTSLITRAQAEAPLVQPGTDLDAAIEASLHVLEVDDPARTQAILVISDGEDLRESLDRAIEWAKDAGIPVYTVFAGTTSPTPLPASSGGTDVTTGQPEILQQIAESTGGTSRDVEQTVGLAVEFRRLQQTRFETDSQAALTDRFTWFAAGALILVTLALILGEGGRPRVPRLRAGVITGLFAIVIAGCGTATWQQMEDGNRSYAAEEYEDALASYLRASQASPEDPSVEYNIANALHMLRRYEEARASAQQALEHAAEADDPHLAALAQYTIGNTAYLREELEAARAAYRAVLRLDPEDRDAKANLELVNALLTPPPDAQQPEQPGGQEPGQEGEGSGENEPGQQPGQNPDGSSGSGDTPGTPADGSTASEGEEPSEPGSSVMPGATLEEVQSALEAALGELGPEITREEAIRILELAQRANELSPLAPRPGGNAPPR